MQLREAVSDWPPEWAGAQNPRGELAQGEVGVLLAVRADKEDLELKIRHEGAELFGRLTIPNRVLRARVLSVLEENRGRASSEIGSLELDSPE